jgi:hypothetical protein
MTAQADPPKMKEEIHSSITLTLQANDWRLVANALLCAADHGESWSLRNRHNWQRLEAIIHQALDEPPTLNSPN